MKRHQKERSVHLRHLWIEIFKSCSLSCALQILPKSKSFFILRFMSSIFSHQERFKKAYEGRPLKGPHIRYMVTKVIWKKDWKKRMPLRGAKTLCEVCQKFVANTKEHLRNHVKVSCTICSKVITKVVKSNLHNHMTVHEKRQQFSQSLN